MIWEGAFLAARLPDSVAVMARESPLPRILRIVDRWQVRRGAAASPSQHASRMSL